MQGGGGSADSWAALLGETYVRGALGCTWCGGGVGVGGVGGGVGVGAGDDGVGVGVGGAGVGGGGGLTHALDVLVEKRREDLPQLLIVLERRNSLARLNRARACTRDGNVIVLIKIDTLGQLLAWGAVGV